ncbi:TPA: phage tail assembly protein [Pasteurella multocida]|uniref:phage tail assembly protein n=1 Tax=Pasteurella multocida TaxID=747 RepID=UPI0009D6C0C8|nr:phage tail assembly protein [Pasteurella multocida]HDR1103016.1 phage tail assembly protein [Pasteurella multocida]HDR1154420.1 phage tail assembly protein [Pasteurella multocida]HDR1165444.1 phage tail assembly protein [Pasteurella multocida]HDR1345673.1 phage tail assembly protein [Pasteurella multocida]HDR1500034.1 phage tail assembly protein [Pasteurella multocida]
MTAKEKETIRAIALSVAIQRGDQEIKEVQVLKPTVPALKGLKMFDVLQVDVNAMEILLPRITVPKLHKSDFAQMAVEDFTELATAAVSFLGKNSTEAEES